MNILHLFSSQQFPNGVTPVVARNLNQMINLPQVMVTNVPTRTMLLIHQLNDFVWNHNRHLLHNFSFPCVAWCPSVTNHRWTIFERNTDNYVDGLVEDFRGLILYVCIVEIMRRFCNHPIWSLGNRLVNDI